VQRRLAGLVWLVDAWAVLLLVAMVLLVVAGVFYRYALDASLVWYDEFASYLLVWLTFYGAVAVSYHRRHIAFETLAERLGPTGSRVIALVGEALVLGFQAVLAYYGWVALEAMTFDSAVSVPWLQMPWVYSVLPVTGALMCLISAARLVDLLRGAPVGERGPIAHKTAE
jgi:TRAP-type C4-dicarboxylate transport system permease small subunit